MTDFLPENETASQHRKRMYTDIKVAKSAKKVLEYEGSEEDYAKTLLGHCRMLQARENFEGDL